MKKLLLMPWELAKALFGLAFPMFRGGASVAATGGSIAAWMARGALLAVILLGLGLLNQWSGVKSWIGPGRIRDVWLPLLAFCIYAMIWLGWLLVRVLSIQVDPATTEFPDIDHAWSQAVAALGSAQIHLEETPLFLILGWSADGEEPLFHAAGIRAQVKQVPRDPIEPLHVTANHDAIWVSCPGASVLGQQNPGLLGGDPSMGTLETLSEQDADLFKTMAAAGGGATIRFEDFIAAQKKARAHASVSHHHPNRIDTDKFVKRLRYLCRLIARDRQGFCPINGVLLVLPITAAHPDNSLDELALACKADLAAAFSVFPMRCPVLVLVSDLEKLPGFIELVERLPSGQAVKRMGQRFPLLPDLDNGEAPGQIESSVSWIGNTLFPSMVYSRFTVESPGGEDSTDVLKANSQLYRFLAKMRERQDRMARLVRDSIPAVPDEPILFGGCYLAGTGGDSASGQAFASGVLKRLIDDQDKVTWTESAMQEDASLLRLASGLRLAFLGVIGLLILAILFLIGRHFLFQSAEPPAVEAETGASP
jgi:hypothetical protein